jgi:polysaccharide pyruvyl transferase WcaK-like protein
LKNIPSIALHGNYFDNNFGDLLLFKIFERWVRSASSCQIIYPMVPEIERTRFGTHFSDAIWGVKSFKAWDALVYCGGGHFGDSASGSRFLPGNFDKRFIRQNVLPAELSMWKRKPYAIVGMEVGPIPNIFIRREAKRIFRHARAISVRNVESRDYIEERLGIKQEVICAPDPAVMVSKEDIPQKAEEKIDRLLGQHANKILLGIHHPRDFLYDFPAGQSLREGLISVLKSSNDVTPVLFTDIGDDKHSVHCQKLAHIIKAICRMDSVSIPFLGIWETVALISRLSALLTTKLHVGVVAYAMGVYCESFANHPKTKRFYALTGRNDQCILFKETTQETAMEKIMKAIDFGRRKPLLRDASWERIRMEAQAHKGVMSSFLKSFLQTSN